MGLFSKFIKHYNDPAPSSNKASLASRSVALTTAQLRQAFLDFFVSQGHTLVPSSSLVPVNDDTLFFTNAGMVQFKNVFLGLEKRSYNTATSVQRCLRASGKHNDLENVGYTKRHHTFFEMLGNFSFGAYFKKEAIHFAWTFLTEKLGLPPERLWITVHQEDEEAENLWQQEFKTSNKAAQGLSRLGDEDNLWAMGDVGPCGYSSEIYYDHGTDFAGDPPGGKIDGERYTEIWNLVFMQFNRDASGERSPLPKPSIDTGIGLERLAAVLQGVHDNYDIDLFKEMLDSFKQLVTQHTSLAANTLKSEDYRITSRIAVDHIRSSVFLLADGVLPSNEKQGYVLRSIMRRAMFYLYKLGIKEPFFYRLAPIVVKVMGPAYRELKLEAGLERFQNIIQEEEQRFLLTLGRGIELLKKELQLVPHGGELSGKIIFKMHDTYGLPLALSHELAKQAGLSVDEAGFKEALAQQQQASRADQKTRQATSAKANWLMTLEATKYVEPSATNGRLEGRVLAIATTLDQPAKTALHAGETGIVVLDKSAFYAESGGAISDQGYLISKDGRSKFNVKDTQKQGQIYLHYGVLECGELHLNDELLNEPDLVRQRRIRANHSATHLLQATLRQLLGSSIEQRGSRVDDQSLRFDFTCSHNLDAATITKVETLVNENIIANLPVVIESMSLEAAKAKGAMALFNERYGDVVRVVNIGTVSSELCGGLHVANSSAIGSFKIEEISSVAAGVKRIVAVTGLAALASWQQLKSSAAQLSEQLNCDIKTLPQRLNTHLMQSQELKQQVAYYQQLQLNWWAKDLKQRPAITIDKQGTWSIVLGELIEDNLEAAKLRQLWDQFKDQADIILVARLVKPKEQRQSWLVGLSKQASEHFSAKALLEDILKPLGGKGGGDSKLAQGSAALKAGEEHLFNSQNFVEKLKTQLMSM